MKLLLICSGLSIFDTYSGGVPSYVRALAETLTKRGHKVTVLDTISDKHRFDTSYNVISFRNKLAPFYKSGTVSNRDVRRIERLIKRGGFDVVHVNMMIDLPPQLLRSIKKYAKLVVSLHDYSLICRRITMIDKNGQLCSGPQEGYKCNTCIAINETVRNKFVLGLCKLIGINVTVSRNHENQYAVVKDGLRYSDSLLAVSARVRQIYQQNGISNPRFLVNHIGNPTAHADFRSKVADLKNKRYERRVVLGFIGNFTFHKGAESLIQLASRLPERDFHIHGLMGEGYLEKIKAYPNIEYHGRYVHSELAGILSRIDVGLVLPVWEDAAPQVVFEFLNANIPIVASRMGGISDFVDDSNGFLFDNSPMGIDNAVAFLRSDRVYGLMEKIIRGTKTMEQHAEEIEVVYKSL